MGENSLYVAVIGDIKKSKTIEERNVVQRKLNNVLAYVNRDYAKDISAKFMITLGDEFQGLLCNGNGILDIIAYIRREMAPISIRFGVGIGNITTDIDSEKAIGADGPAYHRARAAIENVKKAERQKKNINVSTRIEIGNSEKSIEKLLNVSISMMEVIQREWTARQREIITDYDLNQDGQENCAKRLGIAQSSVQRGLTGGHYYQYKNAKDTINEILEEIRIKDV